MFQLCMDGYRLMGLGGTPWGGPGMLGSGELGEVWLMVTAHCRFFILFYHLRVFVLILTCVLIYLVLQTDHVMRKGFWWDGRVGWWISMVEDLWYVTSFIMIGDVQSGTDMVLTCFRFSFFVFSLCWDEMRSVDAYAYMWCFCLDEYCLVDPVDGGIND